MTKIYVLTEGSYSDYHIIGVYSTEELAQEAQLLNTYSEIEEYDLNHIPDHPPGHVAWTVMFKDAEIHATYRASPFDTIIPSEHGYNSNARRGICASYIVHCWATDEDHARKIALDKFYQYQAQQAGVAV
jgi:hypothetical protein